MAGKGWGEILDFRGLLDFHYLHYKSFNNKHHLRIISYHALGLKRVVKVHQQYKNVTPVTFYSLIIKDHYRKKY